MRAAKRPGLAQRSQGASKRSEDRLWSAHECGCDWHGKVYLTPLQPDTASANPRVVGFTPQDEREKCASPDSRNVQKPSAVLRTSPASSKTFATDASGEYPEGLFPDLGNLPTLPDEMGNCGYSMLMLHLVNFFTDRGVPTTTATTIFASVLVFAIVGKLANGGLGAYMGVFLHDRFDGYAEAFLLSVVAGATATLLTFLLEPPAPARPTVRVSVTPELSAPRA